MDPVLEDQIKMGPVTLRKSVKPRAEQILELAPPDMVSVVHVSSGMANFDEKVQKPQSRSYCRIGANMQLFYTYIIILNTSISALRLMLGSEGLHGTLIDALNSFSSKLMTLTPREDL